MRIDSKCAWAGLAVAGVLVSPVSQAQSTADAGSTATGPEETGGLTEITVTATRRSEALSRVPISVTAVTQDQLEEQGIKTVADLQRTTPGLVFTSATNTIAIRGISSTAGASTTGVYIDDTPIQLLGVGIQTVNAVPALYDLERVEVLRGPQGTLFGAGAQGGVVRYITPQPSLTKFSGNALSELGFIEGGGPDYEMSASLGGPIVEDKLGFRVNVFYRGVGGWIDRIDYRDRLTAERNANNGAVYGGHLAMTYAPTENLQITPSVVMQYRSSNRASLGIDLFSKNESDPSSGQFISHYPQDIPQPDHWALPAVKIQYDMGPVELISNTSYLTRRQQGGYGGIEYMTRVFYNTTASPSGVNYPYLPGVQTPLITAAGVRLPIGSYDAYSTTTNRQDNFTQEVRLQSNDPTSRLTWVAGVYFQHNRGANYEREFDPHIDNVLEALFGVNATQYFGMPLLVKPYGLMTYDSPTKTLDKQIAGFGQVDFGITEKLKLTAGIRYSHNEYDFSNAADGPINGGLTPSTGQVKDSPTTPKLGVSYQADPGNLFYATYAKGYRIGGVNAYIPRSACEAGYQQLGIDNYPTTYKPDTTASYEVGSKNRIGNSVQIATSVYYIKWNSIQTAVSIPICGFRYIENDGEAVSKGADVQAQANLFGITFDAALGYTRAAYTQDIVLGGNKIIRNGTSIGGPEWTLATGAQYDFHAFERESYVRLDYQHRGPQYGLTNTQDPLIARTYDRNIPIPPPTNYFTARVGTHLDNLELALFADNLLNSHTILTTSHSGRTNPDYSQTSFRPRTISVIATYKF